MEAQALSLLQAFRDPIALGRRRALRRLILAFGIAKDVLLIACFAFGAFAMWGEWSRLPHIVFAHRGPSDSLLVVVVIPLEVIVWLQVIHLNALERTLGSDGRPLPSLAYAHALTNMVAVRDPALAPVADDQQVDALPPGGRAVADEAAEAIAPLAHPARALAGAPALYAVLGGFGGALLIALGAGGALLPTLVSADGATLPVGAPSIVTWVQANELAIAAVLMGCALALIGAFLGIWALITWRYVRGAHGELSVAVDVDGLTVREAGMREGERRLRWSAIRGFARFRYKDAWLRTHDVYLLSDGSTDVLWEATPVSKYTSPATLQREEAMRASALRLVTLLAQRIQPPLVDVTETIETTLIGVTGLPGPRAWDLPDRARFVALQAGDTALARDLWAYRYPGKGAPARQSVSTRISASLRSIPRFSRDQRQAVLRLARAWLPYLPTDEQLGITPRTRALRRAYWRFVMGEMCIVLGWALLLAALNILQMSARLY